MCLEVIEFYSNYFKKQIYTDIWLVDVQWQYTKINFQIMLVCYVLFVILFWGS